MPDPRQAVRDRCTSELFCCHCELLPGHADDHQCSCGGRWDQTGAPTRLPQQIVSPADTPAGRIAQSVLMEMLGPFGDEDDE